MHRIGKFSSIEIVTSPKVWAAVGKQVMRGLRGLRVRVHKFNDAEAAKNLNSIEIIARSLVRAGADRRTAVIAVGGGVVGDVAGFAAASYLRGVALVQVPPKLVVVDTHVLKTLPHREFRGGLAEVIKYGAIADAKLFGFLERNFERVLARDARSLEYLISRSAQIKSDVVSKDERESGLREILNFGHTFGHALESVTAYKKYQHGEAVAWGMMAAALYGHEIGVTPPSDAARIVALVRRMGKLPEWPRVAPKKLIELMGSDKKTRAGKLRFVLTAKIGKAATYEARDLYKLELVLRMTPRVAEAEPV